MTRDIQAEVQALIASIQRQDEPQVLKAIESLLVGLLTDINELHLHLAALRGLRHSTA